LTKQTNSTMYPKKLKTNVHCLNRQKKEVGISYQENWVSWAVYGGRCYCYCMCSHFESCLHISWIIPT